MGFKLQSDVPLPQDYVKPNERKKYPFKDMVKGNSFFAPSIEKKSMGVSINNYLHTITDIKKREEERKKFDWEEREEEYEDDNGEMTKGRGVRVWYECEKKKK